jgi:hypothetical protein
VGRAFSHSNEFRLSAIALIQATGTQARAQSAPLVCAIVARIFLRASEAKRTLTYFHLDLESPSLDNVPTLKPGERFSKL